MNAIRCSSLPMAWACPESQNLPSDAPRLNLSNEPAELGTAAHRWLASHVQGVELDRANLAAEHGCDADELGMLCAQGAKAFTKLREYFHAADEPIQVEVPLETGPHCNLLICGTADVLARQGDTALILDWKSGRVESDYTHQLRGYAYAAIEHLYQKHKRRIADAVVITVWLRDGVWDIEKLTAGEVAGWASEFGRRLKNGRGSFNPGGHCQYCQRSTSCEGRRALVRSTIADLSVEGVKAIEWTLATRAELGEQIGKMYGIVKLVEGAAEDFRQTLRADVEAHGPLPIGGGRQLALNPVNKRVLDPAKARPVLARHLSAEEIDSETTISVSGCEALAVAKAEKGRGAATKRAMAAELEEAGAVSINPVFQLRESKIPN